MGGVGNSSCRNTFQMATMVLLAAHQLSYEQLLRAHPLPI